MYSVYQHWDPLKTCIVGKTYPPEFFSWIKNSKTRSVFERIAQETEEDYQSLTKLLQKFNVEVLRPNVPSDSDAVFNPMTNTYLKPPMAPRDYTGMYGESFIFHRPNIKSIYTDICDPSWPIPSSINTYQDILNLEPRILDEIRGQFGMDFDECLICNDDGNELFYGDILNKISNHCNVIYDRSCDLDTASVTRIGKDIYVDKDTKHNGIPNVIGSDYRINLTSHGSHSDGVFCPVVPGLIISLNDIPTYKDTFPDWEVIYLPDQSWDKVQPFLDLKEKNYGKWWIPGEEYNNDIIEVVDTWLNKWVGYVEESVFDVNMLVIDEKNVVVNNYNKQVFDALERYGVTPHICNFRHRYFWDGGLHCITADVNREGEMKDYFPERG